MSADGARPAEPSPVGSDGGDPACWLGLLDPAPAAGPVLVELSAPAGEGGVIWSLPHHAADGRTPDLDANLVQLGGEGAIGAHTNVELDVFVVVLEGSGRLVIDGAVHEVRRGTAVLVPRGCERAVLADGAGLRYLSIHRRRDGLRIGPASGGTHR